MWLWSPREPDERGRADPEQARKQAHMQPDTLAAAQQIDFSLLALFFRATFTVKIVMLVLIAASFWSWAIIIQKLLDLRRVRDEARAFDQEFWSGEPLDTVYDRVGPEPAGAAARVFAAGMTELAAVAPPGRRADRRHPGADRAGDGRRDRPRGREAEQGAELPRHRRVDRALRRALRHGLGHQARLRGDRAAAVDQPRGGRARHRRGAARHRARAPRRDPGGDLLQQAHPGDRAGRSAATRASPTSSR